MSYRYDKIFFYIVFYVKKVIVLTTLVFIFPDYLILLKNFNTFLNLQVNRIISKTT